MTDTSLHSWIIQSGSFEEANYGTQHDIKQHSATQRTIAVSLTCLHLTMISRKSLQAKVCSAAFCLLPVGTSADTDTDPGPAPDPFPPLLPFPLLALLEVPVRVRVFVTALLDDEYVKEDEDASGICSPGPPSRTELMCDLSDCAICSVASPNILCCNIIKMLNLDEIMQHERIE